MMPTTTATSNRRAHARKHFKTPVRCHIEPDVAFQGSDQLKSSVWTCIDLAQGGMLLEAKESSTRNIQYFEKIQGSIFGKSKAKKKIYYPALPPEKLKVSVEVKFSKKMNSFIFHGSLAWFRHVSKGVYRMGIRFEEGQDLHIYQNRNGQLVMTVLWKESDL